MTKKVFIVLKHEFTQKVRSRSFIILTLTGPIILALIFTLPVLLGTMNSGGSRTVAVIDQTGVLLPGMEAQPDRGNSPMSASVQYKAVSPSTSIDSLNRLVRDKVLTGYLIIPAAVLDSGASATPSATLHLANTNDLGVEQSVTSAYESAATNKKLSRLGYDSKVFEKVKSSVSVETFKVNEKSEEKSSAASFIAGYASGFLLYMSMLIYGITIMRSVIEEKSSRVMEIVVSSVDPIDLLVGKVLGVGLAGLLQMSVWACIMAVAATVGLSNLSALTGGSLTMSFSPFVFIYFVVYFIFGYLLYATLYAAAGATAEQESDVQQISMPITFLVIIPIMTLASVIQSPSSTMSVVLSLIPFFTPILMMGRIFSETPPVWQIALSFVVMAATFFGVLMVASRIYRVGILMYGKRFTLPEVMKWIRYSH